MIGLFLFALTAPVQDLVIEGHRYEKLETREATEDRMLELLLPATGTWGDWHMLKAFPFPGFDQGGLSRAFQPEEQLATMGPDEAGPDLALTYEGKLGKTVGWTNIGRRLGSRVDFHTDGGDEWNDFATGYLYTAVESDRAGWLEVDCGSDDGLRLWWNGELLVDVDVPRGLDPHAHSLKLPLYQGTNHLFVKVTEGQGGWDFQLGGTARLEPASEAALYDQLDVDFPASRDREAYRVTTIPAAEGQVIEVGGIDFFADGTPVVCTRRGEVWRILGAYDEPATNARYELYAEGLHEPLGLSVAEYEGREAVYVVQRGELTRMRDLDGDHKADRFETVCDDWGVSGNYHEFAFGPRFDSAGNAVVTLNVGFCGSLGKSAVPYRGWCVKVTPEGELIPWCDGLRSPNGIGQLGDEFFYVDNQGDYVATCRLTHLAKDSWAGHPASLRWREDGGKPKPPRQPASIWFPYAKMGQSSADIATLTTAGFGPFEGQMFVGDQTLSSVGRVALEKVEGFWQGACFPFVEKLQSGVNRVAFAPDGSMFVGQTDRGWGSVGRTSFGVQRIRYRGDVPFEIRTVEATEDGFALEFTEVVDLTSAVLPSSYAIESWTYPYHSKYGAPEVERETHSIEGAALDVSKKRVRLVLDDMREGFVYGIKTEGVLNAEGEPAVHPVAYYTLQRVPGRDYGGPELPKVLFLTHSAGYMHQVVKRPKPAVLAHAEKRLLEVAKGRFEVFATQDCSHITREELDNWDVVAFYTTGELPVADDQRMALIDWVRDGGAFVGMHCATDTYYALPAYQEMIGGVFDGHPWHEEVLLRNDDSGHPSLADLDSSWMITDEIYQFRQFKRPTVHELVRLVNESVEVTRGKRADQNYAVSWCKPYGQGRVFYTSLGHREEVWNDKRFTDHVLDGIDWALHGPDTPIPAPEGAIALTGEGTEGWRRRGGGEFGWQVEGDALEVVPGKGDSLSVTEFGDAWIHVEFNVPRTPEGTPWQARGNSGVYVHGRYEVQILDSLHSDPYRLGDAGAIYGVALPEVNACREAGRWQSYDIEFTAPRFDAAGSKTSPAKMSVWHNGIPIHREQVVDGPTAAGMSGEVPRGPLLFQDHGHPVAYRNVWVIPR